MRGDWQDYIIHPDGRRELHDEGRNLIVNSAYVAIASAMKRDPAYGGFMYWAVGDGNTTSTATWDAGVLLPEGDPGRIAPAATDAQLAREIFRKLIDPADIVFIDSLGNPSGTPTNRLQIKVTFTESEPGTDPSYAFREWGLYGGNATGAANSGILINHKVHKTYEKTPDARLERILRFTF